MILVKCKCGCFASLDEKFAFSGYGMNEAKQEKTFVCQNCFNNFSYMPGEGMGLFIQQAAERETTVQLIPENANIKVSFDLNVNHPS